MRTAPITDVETTRPEWLDIAGWASLTLAVRCPFCGHDHHHGGSPWNSDHGTRHSHCGRGEYRISDPDRLAQTLRDDPASVPLRDTPCDTPPGTPPTVRGTIRPHIREAQR